MFTQAQPVLNQTQQRPTAVFALSKGAPGAVYIYRVQNMLAESVKVTVSDTDFGNLFVFSFANACNFFTITNGMSR